MATIKPPTGDEIKDAINIYSHKVGLVVMHWNGLLEIIGQIFLNLTNPKRPTVALGIWYYFESDRQQLTLFRDILKMIPAEEWKSKPPEALEGLDWLLERSVNLIDARNNVVHAPTAIVTSASGTQIAGDPGSWHKRAKNLAGKSLLDEADYCINRADALQDYALRAFMSLLGGRHEHSSWPSKPVLQERPNQSKHSK